ncbi:MAG: DNA/RNA non-specific endonuclease [Alloprevotella sp.]|nr:DNA/RNA non-specific endonuclease [Alloprevotella sp.]
MKHILYILAAAAVVFTVAACGGDDDGIELGKQGGGGSSSASTLKERDADKRLEVPARKSSNVFISHWTVEGKDSVMNYCFEYDRTANHTRWVAYRFDGVTSKTVTGRSNEWAEDPKLSKYVTIGAGYFSNYNRGHICPSADRLYSVVANQQTFFTSNMSPQNGTFNAGRWAQHEKFVCELGQRCYPQSSSKYSQRFADTLYVVKGGTIASGQTIGTSYSSNGLLMVVPKYYFVALLKVKNGVYNAVAFRFNHEALDTDPLFNAFDYAMPVRELEEKTGIDFFHNLPDNVEKSVETTFSKSAWS